jgi:hypothetical protein
MTPSHLCLYNRQIKEHPCKKEVSFALHVDKDPMFGNSAGENFAPDKGESTAESLSPVRMKTGDGIRGARIAFVREVSSPAAARGVLVEMVQQARSQAE